MKPVISILVILSIVASLMNCSITEGNSNEKIYRNQTGTLRWAGSPAVDGAGMLFIVGETEYGAPGMPSDYPVLFSDNRYEVTIVADFKLTGKKAVRGWGATYPAIEFIKFVRK